MYFKSYYYFTLVSVSLIVFSSKHKSLHCFPPYILSVLPNCPQEKKEKNFSGHPVKPVFILHSLTSWLYSTTLALPLLYLRTWSVIAFYIAQWLLQVSFLTSCSSFDQNLPLLPSNSIWVKDVAFSRLNYTYNPLPQYFTNDFRLVYFLFSPTDS